MVNAMRKTSCNASRGQNRATGMVAHSVSRREGVRTGAHTERFGNRQEWKSDAPTKLHRPQGTDSATSGEESTCSSVHDAAARALRTTGRETQTRRQRHATRGEEARWPPRTASYTTRAQVRRRGSTPASHTGCTSARQTPKQKNKSQGRASMRERVCVSHCESGCVSRSKKLSRYKSEARYVAVREGSDGSLRRRQCV
jgi:hypothetical protein